MNKARRKLRASAIALLALVMMLAAALPTSAAHRLTRQQQEYADPPPPKGPEPSSLSILGLVALTRALRRSPRQRRRQYSSARCGRR